ncbi:MAG: hypothetical protein KAS38_00780 [Anaerolineales bacterium]|nr:hypothetical protein [Anaerolineales bacterium]MCK4975526.1 hypothetical protein [Anaerolineales bacterium]MCK5314675.1 hypothetical protein [Anaerolineales bacterium]MCK5429126.1 hypothetical protein [Anaerolineales bacterium]
MIIETNEPLIKRNTRIAQIASLAGLAVLAGGMIIAFTRADLITISFVALLVGFILSQVGIYFTNRWGRKPRPDESLNQALKGLDNKYALYHYLTPVSHLLVGPAGVWVLLLRPQRGTITYSKGRWRQKGGGLLQGYLRIFAQEGLGRPDLEIANEVEGIHNYLAKQMSDSEIPPIDAAVVFTHPNADIQIEDSDEPLAPTLYLSKVKNFIRKAAKSKPISMDKIKDIQQAISDTL